MIFRKYLRPIFLFFAIFVLAEKCFSQLSITGPTCVTAGTSYQYTISGPWSSSTYMSWSISNGVITGTSSTSTSGTPKPTIYITWSGNGTVSLTTGNPSGSASKAVTVSSTLNAGSITNATQTIGYNTVPATITSGSGASGGNCSPSYAYQWQSSPNNASFTDLAGKTSLTLTFSSPLLSTTYYRRKVTETSSGSIAYSNSATVTVMPELYPNAIVPASQDIFVGSAASNLSIPNASGGNCSGNYTYSWQFSTDNVSWSTSGLGTQNGLVPGSPNATIFYRRKVVCGSEIAYSNSAAINVYTHLTVGAITPGSATIVYGSAPGTLVASASGGICASYTYQWLQSSDSLNWSSSPSGTSASFSPGALITTTYFKLQVNCGSETVFTPVVKITVAPPFLVGTLTGALTSIPYNSSPGFLSVSGTAGGNCQL